MDDRCTVWPENAAEPQLGIRVAGRTSIGVEFPNGRPQDQDERVHRGGMGGQVLPGQPEARSRTARCNTGYQNATGMQGKPMTVNEVF
jgi:hypothetical protein